MQGQFLKIDRCFGVANFEGLNPQEGAAFGSRDAYDAFPMNA